MPADHGIGVLEDVYPDRYAELLRGEPPLPRLVVSVRKVRIDDVGLTDPDALLKDDPVLVAVPSHGGKYPVPPLPGALVRYLERLGDAVQGHAVAHEPNGRHPACQPAAGMLEERPCKRAVSAPTAKALSISVRHSAQGYRAWCARTRMTGSRDVASAKVSKPVCLRQQRPAMASGGSFALRPLRCGYRRDSPVP